MELKQRNELISAYVQLGRQNLFYCRVWDGNKLESFLSALLQRKAELYFKWQLEWSLVTSPCSWVILSTQQTQAPVGFPLTLVNRDESLETQIILVGEPIKRGQ